MSDPLRRWVSLAAFVLLAFTTVAPAPVLASSPKSRLVAYLDGKPMKLSDVGNWYCEDFSHPVIHCYSDPKRLETNVAARLAATSGVTYLVIYDYTSFAGAYMYVSSDYLEMATIGWNDRVSSFRGANSETGHLYTDWFYGGSAWYFCCNSQYASLGSYDNSFSSMHQG